MKKVFKYTLPVDAKFTLKLPRGAELLHVAQHHGVATLWALVDPDAKPESRLFRLAGTGHAVAADIEPTRHVGTFLIDEGASVSHLFEILDSQAST